MREQVVRFLFNHTCKRDYGKRSDGELSHGPLGLLEYYHDFFGTTDNIEVMEFLRILSNPTYDDQTICPCGAGQKIRRCHHRLLKKARKHQTCRTFEKELREIMNYVAFSVEPFA